MTQHVVWIGVDAEKVLCGNNRAHSFVQNARNASRVITTEGLRLEAIRADNTVLGYGAITTLIPARGITLEGNDLAADTERVRSAFQKLGLHGPVTIHIQPVDMPEQPIALA